MIISVFNDRKPVSASPAKVAIVGAGLSGLVAAHLLNDHGHDVNVFEKARGPGGRMSTRRTAPYAFDHGAQYFTVRDPHFKGWVDRWAALGIAQLWNGRIRVLGDGSIRKEKGQHQRYVGVPGMSAAARHLANVLDICWNTPVDRIKRDKNQICLFDKQGDGLGCYDALAVAAPPEQGHQLLVNHSDIAKQLAAVHMMPCWSVLLAFGKPLPLPFDGAFIKDSDIDWAARNTSKPGRSSQECWVLHGSGAWSSDNLRMSPQAAIQHMVKTFFTITDRGTLKPEFATAHLWRYARALKPLSTGCLWDSTTKIGACGDWCAGSRVEGAFLSGEAMAGKIIADFF